MRFGHLSTLVLLLGACSTSSERETGLLLSGMEVKPQGSMFLQASSGAALPALPSRSDTLPWTTTTSRGDTTFFSQGRVVTTTVVLADSQWIQVPPHPIESGIPFGLFNVWRGIQLEPNTDVFTMTYGGETPKTFLTRLAIARERGLRMVIAMTGGGRAPYLTDGVFDMEKWKARMDQFNTPEIRAAVAEAVSEGTLMGNSVMDEPFNTGGPGNEANSWGPRGTLNKARVDSMCGYAKAIFPTLPQGVFHDHRLAPESSYYVCDFLTSQYRAQKGSVTKFRDEGLALCRRDHIACSFALNLLDGGIQAKRKLFKTGYEPGDCPLTTTGGRGTYFPNCRMTAAQVAEFGRVLGPAGCFLTGWRYDTDFMAKPENQQAMREVIATLATQPIVSCVRR
jgi:hypothetical protein